MERLGKNLAQIYQLHGKVLSISQIVGLGLQLVDSIESLHSLGYIHNDIKLDNIVVGVPSREIKPNWQKNEF